MIQRIHIVGGPGSGKTTLARRLAAQLQIPTYDLDDIAFEGPHFQWRPLEARLADVSRIAAQPAWVTEGVWLGWVDELLHAADVVVWLDAVTAQTALQRCLGRFAHDSWQETKRQPGARKVTRFGDYWRNLALFSRSVYHDWMYYTLPAQTPLGMDARAATTRAATAQHLTAFAGKLVHCRSAADSDTFCRRVMSAGQARSGQTPERLVWLKEER